MQKQVIINNLSYIGRDKAGNEKIQAKGVKRETVYDNGHS